MDIGGTRLFIFLFCVLNLLCVQYCTAFMNEKASELTNTQTKRLRGTTVFDCRCCCCRRCHYFQPGV